MRRDSTGTGRPLGLGAFSFAAPLTVSWTRAGLFILSARFEIRYWGRSNSDVNSSCQGFKKQTEKELRVEKLTPSDHCQATEASNHLGYTNVLVLVQPTKDDILILSF